MPNSSFVVRHSSFLLLLVGLASAQESWGPDRQLVAGVVGQYGVAADRTPGRDTCFVGAILSGGGNDTLKLYRTTNRGAIWTRIWQAPFPGRTLSNLTLRVVSGVQQWVFMFWITNDGINNGDVTGVRVTTDGRQAQYLNPTLPDLPDTVAGLAFTRSFDRSSELHLFWQDERGLAGPARSPLIQHSWSQDYGLTWSSSIPVPQFIGVETPDADYGAPGQIYMVGRSVTHQDIELATSYDEGQSWNLRWITYDSARTNDLSPRVAAPPFPPTHIPVLQESHLRPSQT